jgi:hypothetical protein
VVNLIRLIQKKYMADLALYMVMDFTLRAGHLRLRIMGINLFLLHQINITLLMLKIKLIQSL